MHRYDRRPLVVRLVEHEPSLHARPVGRKSRELRLQVRGQLGATVRLGGCQLGDLGQRAGSRLKVTPDGYLVTQLIGPPQEGLGGSGIVPQARIARARVQLGKL